MKRRIGLFLVTALICAGLVLSCGGDDPPKPGPGEEPPGPGPVPGVTYSITFDANGGKFADGTTEPKVVVTGTNGRATFPADPTNGYTDDFFGAIDDMFDDWVDSTGAAVSSTKVFAADTTLKAKWNRWTKPEVKPIAEAKTVSLGYYTWDNAPTQRGWRANGNDGNTTDLEWDDVIFARYLVLETKGTGTNNFGEIALTISGNLAGGWTEAAKSANLTYARGTDTVWLVFDLFTLGNNYMKFVRGTAGKFLLAYYTPNISGLAIQNAYLTDADLSDFAEDTADTTLGEIVNGAGDVYGFVTKEDLGFTEAITSPVTVTFNVNTGTPSPANVTVENGKGMGLLYPGHVTKGGYDFLGWFDGTAKVLELADMLGADFDLDTEVGTWGSLYGPLTPITTAKSLMAGWKEQSWPADPTPEAIVGYSVEWTVVVKERPDLDGDEVNDNPIGQIEIGGAGDWRTALIDPILDAIDGDKKVTLRLYIARPSTADAEGGWGVVQVRDGWVTPFGFDEVISLPDSVPAVGTNEKTYVDYELPESVINNVDKKVIILNPNNGVIIYQLECWIED